MNVFSPLCDFLGKLETIKRISTYLFCEINKEQALVRMYRSMGILKFRNKTVSGEVYLLSKLRSYWKEFSSLTVFDVGAHNGDYTKTLISYFPTATVYSFEPNPVLIKALKKHNPRHTYQLGLSDKPGDLALYVYADDQSNELSSFAKNVMTDLHDARRVKAVKVPVETLDDFCKKLHVKHINFLKIDTEGYELKVLLGAKRLIQSNNIDFIQFEFNEMNIVTKVFLKDFYDLLPAYSFYRLDTKKLIPLRQYSPQNEIFQFQNILAVRDELVNGMNL